MFVNELHGVSRKGVGEVFGLVLELDPVAIERIVLPRADGIEGPCTGMKSVKIIETAFVRSQAGFEADMPFADHAGGITGFLQSLGQ